MNIAVLSGKGGTGKTLVAVNLATAAEQALYLDCDVEEPNGRLFFQPEDTTIENVYTAIPEIRTDLCNGCRRCVDFCRFNALAFIDQRAVLFPEVCHPCGGCQLLCSQEAIGQRQKLVGHIERGKSGQVELYTGVLKLGEESGVPIVRELLRQRAEANPELTIIDCPPGSACIVMESIQDADYCVLVAEATSFGRHNLEMVYELTQVFGKPCGVVLNKCFDEENPSERFCQEMHIPILERLPYDAYIGTENGAGHILVRQNDHYRQRFTDLLHRINEEGGVQ